MEPRLAFIILFSYAYIPVSKFKKKYRAYVIPSMKSAGKNVGGSLLINENGFGIETDTENYIVWT